MNSQQRMVFNLVVVGIIIVAGTWTLSSLLTPDKSEAAWWNDSWLYRQTVPVANSGSELTNSQIPITIDTATLISAGKIKSDCTDIRVTTNNGKVLNHWVHECNTSTTKIYTFANIPAGSSTIFLYYGNPSAADNEVSTGTVQFPGISCKTVLDHGDGNTNGQYVIDPNAGTTTDSFSAYCDMSTDSGGWTIATSQNGTTNQQGLTSNTEVAGNPFSDESYNTSTQKKQDVSLVSSESLIKRSNGKWLKVSVPLFDGNLTTASQHPHNTNVTLTADDSTTTSTAVSGYSNYLNSGGGDYGITTSVGFDHHNSTTYYHLRSGCGSHYLYKYGTTYNVNTALGSWTQTTACSPSSTAMGPWFAGMRGTIAPLVANITISIPTNEEQSDGPVAYWQFDEGTGTTAKDGTKSGNNGTISGASWKDASSCLNDKCLYFDGTDDYVQINDNSSLDLASGWTIGGWFKPNETTLTGSDKQALISKWQSSSSQLINYYLEIRTNGRLGANVANGSETSKSVSGTTILQPNRWYLLQATFEADTGELKVYVNGKLEGTTATGYATAYTNSGNIKLGRFDFDWSAYRDEYKGYMDDVKIYPYARTIEQIQQDYNKGASAVLGAKDQGTLSNGLVGYWKMDDNVSGDAQTITDVSGNGNNGTTSYGANTTGMSCTSNGKFGQGCTFDGTDDRINVSTNTPMTFATNGTFTIATWIKPDNVSSAWRRGISGSESYLNSGYRFGIENGGKPIFWTTQGGGSMTLTSSQNLNLNNWNHVVVTYNNQNASMYLNGSLVATTTGTYIGGAHDTQIGGFDYGTEKFSGVMDEYRTYNRALSPSEVTHLYNYAPPPVYYAPLDEGTGTTVNDISGNSYNGSIIGSTPQWVQGKYGKALKFNNASGDRVSANTTSGPLTYLNNHTVGFWVKFTDLNDGTYRTVFNHQPTGSDRSPGIWTYASAGTLKLHWRTNPGNPGFTYLGQNGENGTSFELNKWYYLSATKNGATATAYVNGVKVATGTFAEPITMGTGLIRFGGGAGMIIDEVKVYNYPRTSGQIVEDMNAGHPIGGSPVGSMVGHWKFDEGSGTTANNSGNGGSALNGTINGASWANGKFGKALSFDGTDDTITISAGDNSALDGENGFTYSLWMKRTEASTYQWPILIGSSNTHTYYGIRSLAYGDQIAFEYGLSPYSGSSWTNISCGANSLPLNEWHQFTVMYDTTTLSLYKDTKLCQSTNTTLNPTFPSTFYINSGSYKGLIDEVKVYNTALTPDQIKIDYNSGQSLKFGALGTESDGKTPSNSSDRAYCPPGDTTATCGPVAEWKFDERTGTTAKDTSGNENNGTISGATWAQGKVGAALDFDGASDYVNIGDLNSIEQANVTLSTWVKFDDVTVDSDILTKGAHGLNQPLVIWRDDAVGGGSDIGNTDALSVIVYDGTTQHWFSSPSNSLNDTNWHHIVVSIVPATEIKIYIDGALVKSGSITNAGIQNTSANFRIGSDVNGNTSLNGKMDHVQIYNYALSPAQIAWNYNRGAPVAHYKLNECQGATVHSSTLPYNSSLDGTITIGASGTQTSVGTCQTGSTAWGNGASGKYGGSLNFDGTDDYVTIGNDSSLNPTSQVSISLWIKPQTQAYSYSGLVQKGAHNAGYYLRTQNASNISFNVAGTWSACLTTTSPMTAGIWNYVTAVYDGANCHIYVNGKLIMSNAKTGAISPGTGSMSIGKRNSGENPSYNDEHFNGQIDDVQIFNYALTSQQIKTIQAQGAIRFGP